MINKLNKKKLANALRFLSVDAVQLANSGHPGMPLGMADLAEVLWNDFLLHNPNNPNWINRDRFILSNGHGSILQYALLHLAGYDITIQDLRQFRQLHSKTPGHPEYKITPGVEATTGALGQGIAMAVGMALAEKLLAKTFNRPNFNIIDHYTYCFVGDGCLMEGISHEVSSLAGILGLNKLIVFWDNNGISIDGRTANWFTENVVERFTAYNWHVIDGIDGHDPEAITDSIKIAKLQVNKPSLLCCKTIIGYGSPNLAGSEKCHGSPMGKEEILAVRKNLQWEYEPFCIPEEIYKSWDFKEKGRIINSKWEQLLQLYGNKHPELAEELHRRIDGNLPINFNNLIESLLSNATNNSKNIATREASKIVLDALSKDLPELFGGSADLSHSNLTLHNNAVVFNASKHNSTFDIIFNYINYGVREFGMFAIMNGVALHQGFIPYGGTFLVFSDYGKNAIRTSALMQQKVIYVFSHDSIGLGEDGPTHQPIEHLSMLRMTPNVSVWRPCDTIETIIAWQQAVFYNGPTCLSLSRQTLIQQTRTTDMINNIKQGGYILYESTLPDLPSIQAIIIATGSEVELAMQAAKQLAEKIAIRVVSMPNMNIFLHQDESYKERVLPSNILARVAVEAGNTFIWHKFVGLNGKVIGVDQFGLSAPCNLVYQELNITVDAIKMAVLEVI